MEEDRAEADVGPVIDPVVPGAKQETPKQPSRRFVGRKTVAVSAHKRAETNGHIESSTAVQGFSVSSMQEKNLANGRLQLLNQGDPRGS